MLWGQRKLNGNYVRVSQTIFVERFIDAYDKPVLIVVGTADSPDLVASTKEAAERYLHCDYVTIEGDTHCYDNHLDRMVDAVRGWIVER